jgi:excisionase family DNA binding protein
MSPAATRSGGADDEVAAAARSALPLLQDYLDRHRTEELVDLAVEDGTAQLRLPRSAIELFAQILGYMANRQGVTILPEHAELTTQEAADLLNVSRPYLIRLLESGEIEYRKVGSHRRVLAASLLEYRRRDDARRREKADELAALTQEMGLD